MSFTPNLCVSYTTAPAPAPKKPTARHLDLPPRLLSWCIAAAGSPWLLVSACGWSRCLSQRIDSSGRERIGQKRKTCQHRWPSVLNISSQINSLMSFLQVYNSGHQTLPQFGRRALSFRLDVCRNISQENTHTKQNQTIQHGLDYERLHWKIPHSNTACWHFWRYWSNPNEEIFRRWDHTCISLFRQTWFRVLFSKTTCLCKECQRWTAGSKSAARLSYDNLQQR